MGAVALAEEARRRFGRRLPARSDSSPFRPFHELSFSPEIIIASQDFESGIFKCDQYIPALDGEDEKHGQTSKLTFPSSEILF
jgi:hypothetical protein